MKSIACASEETPFHTPDGAERRVLSYGGSLMAAQFNFEANVQSWEHSHPHEQIGYVVSGEIDFFMEGCEPVRLRAGGTYYVPSNVKHYIKSIVPTVLLDCFTPIREDFIEAH
jgi:quercetin dioxygenase-like cupin family protein